MTVRAAFVNLMASSFKTIIFPKIRKYLELRLYNLVHLMVLMDLSFILITKIQNHGLLDIIKIQMILNQIVLISL